MKRNPNSKDWTKDLKFELAAKVLVGNSMTGVADAAHINSEQLCKWVKIHREKGMGASWRGTRPSPNLRQMNGMIDMAFGKYPDLNGLIMRSGIGCQYQHPAYQAKLKGKGIIQSMSRKGNCTGNCIMESFSGTLENEMLYGTNPNSRPSNVFMRR